MNRRDFLASATVAASAAPNLWSQNVPGRPVTTMGFSPDCFTVSRPSRRPLDYLELSARTGAGGAQLSLPPNFEPELPKQIRKRAEELGVYVEITCMMPRTDDTSEFERIVKGAQEAGAVCMRSVCLGGRRYETFDSLEKWKEFVADSRARLARTARIVERMKMPMGIENHKDWTAEEMYPLMKEFGGEYLGICYDFGNNMSLLDDPLEFIQLMAPFVKNAHIKDMAVEEYEDGFYLAEVVLGEGHLPLKQIIDIMVKARPQIKFSMDFLTRSPLKIPCLTDKYWVTMPDRNGVHLAKMLRYVRTHKPKYPLPWLEKMSKEEALALEASNLAKSVAYARDVLGLRK
ncbi:MAG: sugar phosphate isomerase/epimerase family protein [Rhodospirillales bacterium]